MLHLNFNIIYAKELKIKHGATLLQEVNLQQDYSKFFTELTDFPFPFPFHFHSADSNLQFIADM